MPAVTGADGYGGKDVPAVMDGYRGNADGWRGPLRDLRERGLEEPPEPGVGAPGSLRERDRSDLHGIRMAGTKEGANAAFNRFVGNHGVKYEKVVDRPVRDRDGLPAFHHFPAERRRRIRTTDPTESVFAAGPVGPGPA